MCPSGKTLFIPAASLLLLLAAGSQSEVFCQNAVANGQFDRDLSSWSRVSGIGFAQWDSGSVLISNDSVPEGLDTSIDQCVSITGGTDYSFSADLHPDNFTTMSPSGARPPLHTGLIYVLLNFYSSPSCEDFPLHDSVLLAADGRNEWQSMAQNFTSGASAVSALVTLSILKLQSGGNLSGHFDNIFLVASAPPPTDTPLPAPTDTPIPTATPTPTATRTPTATPTPAPTLHRLPRLVPFH